MKASFNHNGQEYDILIYCSDNMYMYAVGPRGTINEASLAEPCFETLAGCIAIMCSMIRWEFGENAMDNIVWHNEQEIDRLRNNIVQLKQF